MTEIYRGPWDPSKQRGTEDPYHPKYPDANGRITPDYGQVATRVVSVEQVATQVK